MIWLLLGSTLTVLVGLLMGHFAPRALFLYTACVQGFLGVFALYRMTRRPALPAEEQTVYQAMPARSTPMAASITQADVRDHRDREMARLSGM